MLNLPVEARVEFTHATLKKTKALTVTLYSVPGFRPKMFLSVWDPDMDVIIGADCGEFFSRRSKT